MTPTVRIQTAEFDLNAEFAALTAGQIQIGGIGSFVGLVRDDPAHPLESLTLEHYPGMTEAAMTEIAQQACERWSLLGCCVLHRVGRLTPGDGIVLVLTAAAHRQAALESTSFLIDWLKTRAPLWKRERFADGTERWVEARHADDEAASRWVKAMAIVGGAVLLIWPALVNVYPLVFSDTAGLAAMGLEPTIGWDKPWVYGPMILLLHWGRSLWGVAAGQGLVVSAMLWLVADTLRVATAWRHLGLCAALAGGSALPWFTPFVMPDIFAPLVVLSLFLLGWGGLHKGKLLAVGALATVAIASHLAHLVLAAGCLVPIALLRTRRLLVCVVPLVLGLGWLLGSNWIGNGVPGISPYGSVFALARLQADGPAADYLREVCPAAGYRLCRWSGELPMDSDAFLWRPDGPVWGGESGPTLAAPEASLVVAATLRHAPVQVLEHALANTIRQLGRVAVGDVLGPQHLVVTVGLLLRTYFPPAEFQRFLASRQVAGTLPGLAAPLLPLHLALLCLGGVATLVLALWWRNPVLAGLAVMVVIGILANAFATGALSGPHDRYGARIAWLVLLPPAFALMLRLSSPRPGFSGPAPHTR